MELCTCSKCILLKFSDSTGQSFNGQLLSRRNRFKHEQDDLRLHSIKTEGPPSHGSCESSTSSFNQLVTDFFGPSTSLDVQRQICIFLAWLHLYGGLSLTNCEKARAFVMGIVQKLQDSHEQRNSPISVPKDLRSILKTLQLCPHLNQTICCPICFSLYHPPNIPETCQYQETSRARRCGCQLFKSPKTRKIKDFGKTQHTPSRYANQMTVGAKMPICLFFTNPLEEWLTWFLSQANIEEDMMAWASQVAQNGQSNIVDIQQGEGWRSTYWKTQISDKNSLNLTFSLFTDWFNPHGNKLAGKQTSLGVFAMNCLDLPPPRRNSLTLTYIAAMIPGPNAPTVVTINHVLFHLVKQLLSFEDGVLINTSLFPTGRTVRVRLLPLLGDIVAVHKTAGYASHSARQFCSWCKCPSDEMGPLRLGKSRTKDETLAEAQAWKNANSLAKQDKLLKNHGMRWSELNRLSYCDPVNDNALRMMHNWLEGILQHHFRVRWCFGIFGGNNNKRPATSNTQLSNKRSRHSEVFEKETEGSLLWEESLNELSDEDDETDSLDAFFENDGLFNEEQKEQMKRLQEQCVLPSGLERPSQPLGEKKAGKWKAAHWYSFFQYLVPLVITEMLVKKPEKLRCDMGNGLVLMNTGALCRCTSIVCARQITSRDGQIFELYYDRYNKTSQKIFKDINIRPNHHYALHIPEQLKRWGPMKQVAEFSGERLIGFLQKIKTNPRKGEMEKTMLIKACALQRLMQEGEKYVQEKKQKNTTTSKITLIDSDYWLLLRRVQKEHPGVRNYMDMPHPQGALILTNYATPLATINHEGSNCHNISLSVFPPNNGVVYRFNGKSTFAMVHKIYQVCWGTPEPNIFLIIKPITTAYKSFPDSYCAAFRSVLSLFKTFIGRIQHENLEVISPMQITTSFAYRLLPPHTFGLPHEAIILRPFDFISLLE